MRKRCESRWTRYFWFEQLIGLAFTERRTAARWTYVGENVGSLVLDILYMRCLLWNMRSLFIEVETWRYWVVRLSDKIQGTQVIRISDKCKILFLDKQNKSFMVHTYTKKVTHCLSEILNLLNILYFIWWIWQSYQLDCWIMRERSQAGVINLKTILKVMWLDEISKGGSMDSNKNWPKDWVLKFNVEVKCWGL